jgi:hypothetical protein
VSNYNHHSIHGQKVIIMKLRTCWVVCVAHKVTIAGRKELVLKK